MNGPQVEAVAAFMQAHVAPGELVIAAVSGGPDSMAMLDLLLRAQVSCGYRLEVAHIHHHLRAASDDEWRFVEAYCAERHLRFHGRHVQVREAAQGQSLEAAAHCLRHAALREILQARGAHPAWYECARACCHASAGWLSAAASAPVHESRGGGILCHAGYSLRRR